MAVCKDLTTFRKQHVEKVLGVAQQTEEWWKQQMILATAETAHVATEERMVTVAGSQLKMGDVMH